MELSRFATQARLTITEECVIRLLLWGIYHVINRCTRPIELKCHDPQPFQITKTSRTWIDELLMRISSDSFTFGNKLYYRCCVVCALSRAFGSFLLPDTCSSWTTTLCVELVEIKLTAPIVTSMHLRCLFDRQSMAFYQTNQYQVKSLVFH